MRGFVVLSSVCVCLVNPQSTQETEAEEIPREFLFAPEGEANIDSGGVLTLTRQLAHKKGNTGPQGVGFACFRVCLF
jgi:hypothetical protein